MLNNKQAEGFKLDPGVTPDYLAFRFYATPPQSNEEANKPRRVWPCAEHLREALKGFNM